MGGATRSEEEEGVARAWLGRAAGWVEGSWAEAGRKGRVSGAAAELTRCRAGLGRRKRRGGQPDRKIVSISFF